ncbi:hypothetical protein ABEB36_013368 [Hypothenemus hampei]|uniref:THAP-type domain-containing protein n=1 Tax=Hypothenemus hampei TaxID=57062 RepID=A0ABD1E7S0_HYPHA
MVQICWALGCKHNSLRNTCSFLRFPADKNKKKRWLQIIRRSDEPSKSSRLCSCHFVEGKKEPSYFEYNKATLFKKHHLTPERKKPRRKKTTTESPMNIVDEIETPSTNEILNDDSLFPTVSSQTGKFYVAKTNEVMYEAELFLNKLDIERKENIIKSFSGQMTYTHICESNKLILEYTGIPCRSIFESLFKLIEDIDIRYYLKWKVQKVSKIDQLLITLMKLRQNFPHSDLAYRFQVSEATITNIVITFIHLLHKILFKTLMKEIPPREKNRSCLPNCASSFTNCKIILDCTEIISSVPRHSMKMQS